MSRYIDFTKNSASTGFLNLPPIQAPAPLTGKVTLNQEFFTLKKPSLVPKESALTPSVSFLGMSDLSENKLEMPIAQVQFYDFSEAAQLFFEGHLDQAFQKIGALSHQISRMHRLHQFRQSLEKEFPKEAGDEIEPKNEPVNLSAQEQLESQLEDFKRQVAYIKATNEKRCSALRGKIAQEQLRSALFSELRLLVKSYPVTPFEFNFALMTEAKSLVDRQPEFFQLMQKECCHLKCKMEAAEEALTSLQNILEKETLRSKELIQILHQEERKILISVHAQLIELNEALDAQIEALALAKTIQAEENNITQLSVEIFEIESNLQELFESFTTKKTVFDPSCLPCLFSDAAKESLGRDLSTFFQAFDLKKNLANSLQEKKEGAGREKMRQKEKELKALIRHVRPEELQRECAKLNQQLFTLTSKMREIEKEECLLMYKFQREFGK